MSMHLPKNKSESMLVAEVERRQENRFPCLGQDFDAEETVPFWAIENMTEMHISALVTDISESGIGLLVENRVKISSGNLYLTITSPDESSFEVIHVKAKVCWLNQQYSQHHKRAGLVFVDVDDETVTQIKQVIGWLHAKLPRLLNCNINTTDPEKPSNQPLSIT